MAQFIQSKKSVRRQVTERFCWRLLIVLLAVGAFFLLSSLESLKSDYQKDRQAPLVIGQFTNPNNAARAASPTPKEEKGHIVPIEHEDLAIQLSSVLFPRKGPAEADDLKLIGIDLAE